MTNPRRIKAITGNSASCLGFSIALPTGSIPAASTFRSSAISTGCWAFSLAPLPHVPSVCPSGVSARCGVELGHGPVELLHRALPGLWREVGVPQGHLDERVAHQLLDDLERDAPHGEMAAVGVPQVVPAEVPLLAADARRPQHTLERREGALTVALRTFMGSLG